VARRLDLRSGAVTLSPAAAGAVQQLDDGVLTTIHGPRWRLFIIGAGQLSRFLAQIATPWTTTSPCATRARNTAPAGTARACSWCTPCPTTWCIEAKLDHRSAVVALTHDPKLDDLALMEALKSDAFYVGAIGSRAEQCQAARTPASCSTSTTRSWPPARPDRPVHRQQDPGRDRDLDPGRTDRRQERRSGRAAGAARGGADRHHSMCARTGKQEPAASAPDGTIFLERRTSR
jgi:hypothetical protein